eukprot:1412229-Pyramimonas_sp.AAC.1
MFEYSPYRGTCPPQDQGPALTPPATQKKKNRVTTIAVRSSCFACRAGGPDDEPCPASGQRVAPRRVAGGWACSGRRRRGARALTACRAEAWWVRAGGPCERTARRSSS